MRTDEDARVGSPRPRSRLPALGVAARRAGLRLVVVPRGPLNLRHRLERSAIRVNLGTVRPSPCFDPKGCPAADPLPDRIAFMPGRTEWTLRCLSVLPGFVIEIEDARLNAIRLDCGDRSAANAPLPPLRYEHDPVARDLARAAIAMPSAGSPGHLGPDAKTIDGIAESIVSRLVRRRGGRALAHGGLAQRGCARPSATGTRNRSHRAQLSPRDPRGRDDRAGSHIAYLLRRGVPSCP